MQNGWTIINITQALLVNESTVPRHLNYFISEQKLTPENGGSVSHLNSEQTKQCLKPKWHMMKCYYLCMQYTQHKPLTKVAFGWIRKRDDKINTSQCEYLY